VNDEIGRGPTRPQGNSLDNLYVKNSLLVLTSVEFYFFVDFFPEYDKKLKTANPTHIKVMDSQGEGAFVGKFFKMG
jgi:hypothetical protein